MNFERTEHKTIPEKIGIGKRTPVEVVNSWNRKIWSPAPFSFDENSNITIPWDWDQIEGKHEPEHISLIFEMIRNEKDSQDIAIWTDDNIEGWFTYRDWTKDGLPFVSDGHPYWSAFTFQKLEDAKKVFNKFGGNGNWMKDHKEFLDKINNDRNER